MGGTSVRERLRVHAVFKTQIFMPFKSKNLKIFEGISSFWSAQNRVVCFQLGRFIIQILVSHLSFQLFQLTMKNCLFIWGATIRNEWIRRCRLSMKLYFGIILILHKLYTVYGHTVFNLIVDNNYLALIERFSTWWAVRYLVLAFIAFWTGLLSVSLKWTHHTTPWWPETDDLSQIALHSRGLQSLKSTVRLKMNP